MTIFSNISNIKHNMLFFYNCKVVSKSSPLEFASVRFI
nr:MAG TPA: hypothetical protein [Caudoviricetes sp.]